LLKNRKSARKSRRRRKAEFITLRDEIKVLRDESQKLKAMANEALKGQEQLKQQLETA
jgi:hypothetical protein